jgi:hypothetical protein
MEYAQNRFGNESVPDRLILYKGKRITTNGEFVDYGYYDHTNGALSESLVHVAALSQVIDDDTAYVYEGHIGRRVAPRDFVLLQAVEECHHRDFFNNNPGYSTDPIANAQGSDDIEKAWVEELPKVIEDRGIKTYSEDMFDGQSDTFDPNYYQRKPQT